MKVSTHEARFLHLLKEKEVTHPHVGPRRYFVEDELHDLYRSLVDTSTSFDVFLDRLVYDEPHLLRPHFQDGDDATYFHLSDNALAIIDGTNVKSLTQSQIESLSADIDLSLEKVEELDLTQERKAQVRHLLIAAKMLAEAPEPPLDTIASLLKRADRIVNYAGFLVGVAGLLITVFG